MFRSKPRLFGLFGGSQALSSQDREKTGCLMVVITAFLWGIIGIFSRELQAAGLSSVQITLIRSGTSALMLLIYLLIKRPQALRIPFSSLWIFAGAGMLGNACQNICYFTTIQKAGLMPAAVLLYTAPCFVVLFSAIFFKEKVPARKL